MKNRLSVIGSLGALLLLAVSITTMAETLTTSVLLTSPTSSPAKLNAKVVIILDVTRDASGVISSSRGAFYINVSEMGGAGSVTITDFHIHEGAGNTNGTLHTDLNLTLGPFDPASQRPIAQDIRIGIGPLQKLLANPDGFYLDLHTTANPAGGLKGYFHKFTETQSSSINLWAPTGVRAFGRATITLNPDRNSKGEITGGVVTLSAFYEGEAVGTNSEITGFHIHKGAAGENGEAVIDSGVNESTPVKATPAKGILSLPVSINAGSLAAFKGLMADPASFYLDLHTKTNPEGFLRGQLKTFAAPPVVHFAGPAFIRSDDTVTRLLMIVTGLARIGGTFVTSMVEEDTPSPSFSNRIADISKQSSNLVRNTAQEEGYVFDTVLIGFPEGFKRRGTFITEVYNEPTASSAPYLLVVRLPGDINPTPATTVDAAKFGALAAPNSIVAAFGSKLATQPTAAKSLPLPPQLDGTNVYVNGVSAGLLYASEGQVNFVIPTDVRLGPAEVVITANDKTVSRGTIIIERNIPAIFTAKGDGAGAPAALASKDGRNFDRLLSDPDGAPAPIDAGDYVALFGIGLRYSATSMQITIGGMAIAPLFVGPQGSLEALDQVNLQIPLALAGKGDVDLVLTLDGKTSNRVRLRIR